MKLAPQSNDDDTGVNGGQAEDEVGGATSEGEAAVAVPSPPPPKEDKFSSESPSSPPHLDLQV